MVRRLLAGPPRGIKLGQLVSCEQNRGLSGCSPACNDQYGVQVMSSFPSFSLPLPALALMLSFAVILFARVTLELSSFKERTEQEDHGSSAQGAWAGAWFVTGIQETRCPKRFSVGQSCNQCNAVCWSSAHCIVCSSSLTAAVARAALGYVSSESGSIPLRCGSIIFTSAPVFKVKVWRPLEFVDPLSAFHPTQRERSF